MATSDSSSSVSTSSRGSSPISPRDPTEIQTFYPTMEEFENFEEYIEFIESQGAHLAGVAKIVPPAGWTARKSGYENIKNMIIKSPIKQKVEGTQGVFTQLNIVHRREMTVREYEELTKQERYAPPLYEGVDDLERKYWRSITMNSPIYGADTPGTLYDDDVKIWNINDLGTILDLLTSVYKKKIQGVNTAYLYFGMWRTTFSWHVEDMNLYSINYLHYGASKFWYAVPPESAYRLENFTHNYFPESYRRCPAFLRHKMTLISPTVLRAHGIPVHKIEQNAGEFMVTFPGGYHAGFNTGYNCAESTNFAMKRWINYGKQAVLCTCDKDAVRISMDIFVEKYQTAEEYEEWMATSSLGLRECARQGTAGKLGGCAAMAPKRHPISTSSAERGYKRMRTATTAPDDEGLEDIKPKQIAAKRRSRNFAAPTTDQNASTSALSNDQKNSQSTNDSNVDHNELCAWAKPLENLWLNKRVDWKAERTYNQESALMEPHCCLCQYFVSRTLANSMEAVPTGSNVRRLISEMCFYKTGENSTALNNENQLESDNLLTCSSCKITVHASCYLGKAAPAIGNDSWQCNRCMKGDERTECLLCCLRGGALKCTNDRQWAHIICALVTPGVSFVDPATRRAIDLERLSWANNSACIFCKSDVGYPIMCSFPSCGNTFHVTCGYHAGVSYEIKDWPTIVSATCPDHNLEANGLTAIRIGDHVYTKEPNKGEFMKGRVYSTTEEIYCVVDFEDGSFSNNLYPKDIIDCKCPGGNCQGSHASGSRVRVLWTDDQEYGATFRRAYRTTCFHVLLENGGKLLCSREELYLTDESLPAEIQQRKSTNVGQKKKIKKETA